MDKPDGSDKWIVTNLDGSHHKHLKYSQQQSTIVNRPTETTPEYEAKITAALRTEAIAKAHEDNMQASDRLRKSIDNLADKLDKFVEAYLAK